MTMGQGQGHGHRRKKNPISLYADTNSNRESTHIGVPFTNKPTYSRENIPMGMVCVLEVGSVCMQCGGIQNLW